MITEIKVASNWITQIINGNLISPQTGLLPPEVTQSQIDKFRMELFNSMLHEFAPDWDYQSPVKCQEMRAIRIHKGKNETQNNCINEAMLISELTYQSLRLHELAFDLIINPGYVVNEQKGDFLYDKKLQPSLDADTEERSKSDNVALARVYAWKYEDCREEEFKHE